jgi:hypothetical protein
MNERREKSKLDDKRTQKSMVRNMSQRVHRVGAESVLISKNRKRQNEMYHITSRRYMTRPLPTADAPSGPHD